jgi:hypothetical protein
MLVRPITYNDFFTGEKVTENFYFNLTSTEIMKLTAGYEGGLETVFQKIIDNKDANGMILEIDRFILTAYGVKDGNDFIKNDEVRKKFTNTPAYDVLFMELSTTEDGLDKFLRAVIPKEALQEIERVEREAKAALKPPTITPVESKSNE